jgi:endonuclease/exonuclease/phosphatase family metal-dependent hydrolase
VALGTQVETPGGKFWAFSTHLSLLRQVNEAQIAHLRSWITSTTGSAMAMIGGDFNAIESSPQMELIRQDWVDIYRHFHPRTDGSTFKVRMPWGGAIWRARLDYLFLQPGPKPCRIVDARHIEATPNHYSDHQSVIARLECDCQDLSGGLDQSHPGQVSFTAN